MVEHLPDRPAVIGRLAAALRPGGVLMLEDLIFGGPATAVAEAATRPADVGPVISRCTDAFAAGLRAAGADPHFGGELPGALAAAGLREIQAEFTHRLIYGGSPESAFYRHNLLERGAQLVSVGLLQQEDLQRVMLATSDPAVSWFTIGLVTAWGRRP